MGRTNMMGAFIGDSDADRDADRDADADADANSHANSHADGSGGDDVIHMDVDVTLDIGADMDTNMDTDVNADIDPNMLMKEFKKAAASKLGRSIPQSQRESIASPSQEEFTRELEIARSELSSLKSTLQNDDDAISLYMSKLDGVDVPVSPPPSPPTFLPTLPISSYLTPPILSITSIYLTQGLLSLTSLARTFLLKDSLHLEPAEAAALGGLFVIPWTIKPIYGILTDTFKLAGSRRKSYLILGGLGASLSNYLLSLPNLRLLFNPQNQITFVVICAIVGSGCIALTDVVADGIVVEETRRVEDFRNKTEEDLAHSGGKGSNEIPLTGPNLQSLCWGAAATGGILSSYSSGSLVDSIGPEGVYRYAAFLPLIVAVVAAGIKEEDEGGRMDEREGEVNGMGGFELVKKQLVELKDAFSNENVWKPALWLFLWQSTPTSEGAFLYFMTNDLSMSAEFLGKVKLVTSVAGLAGVVIYNRWLKDFEIRDVLYYSSLISAPLGLTQLILINHWNRDFNIPDSLFVFGDDAVLTVLGQIAFMPTLVLAAKLCPVGIESTLFALLMSTFNLAGIVGSEIGAFLTKLMGVTATDFTNLGALTIICNLSSLYPLLFIDKFLKVEGTGEDDNEDKGGTK